MTFAHLLSRLVLLAAASTACGVASAQTPRLIWQFSTNNGADWQSSGVAGTNNVIKVRAIVDWTGVSAFGLSGLRHQVLIDNVADDNGPVVPANGRINYRFAAFTWGAATLAVRTTGTTTRIVGLGIDDQEGFISSAQSPPTLNPVSYYVGNPAIIFQFDYRTRSVGGRTLYIRSLIATTKGVTDAFGFHAEWNSSATSFYRSGIYEGAAITIIPAPPALLLVGLPCLVASRRGRSGRRDPFRA
ncbi:MAG: hypothetical protein SFY96_04200 [Planctomycetota bacterium]|nr:hypothetical protein [Planctomycetota bacterium]